MGFPCRSIPNTRLALAARLSTVLAPWVSAILHAASRKRGWLDMGPPAACAATTLCELKSPALPTAAIAGRAMVHGCAQIFVLACELLMVLLLMGGRDMLLVRGLKFSLGRPGP